MKRKYRENNAEYAQLKFKLLFRLMGIAGISVGILFVLYTFLWYRRVGDIIVWYLHQFWGMDPMYATYLYQELFRDNRDIIWVAAFVLIFLVLLRVVLNWFTGYFDMVNQGVDALLSDDMEIRLPSEMAATERKLRAVKSELKQRTLEAQLAEQRKNDLVMYLAHDIRTPLTSVVGYLNLLSEVSDMPDAQREKYVNIALEKAYLLEKMIDEFFEITRYNLQHIRISKEPIDLYYMLVQLSDELSPVLSANGNTTVLKADENLTVEGDPGKLARVFNNILKNAAAYSFPGTEILISAEEKENVIVISFANQGKTIPAEKLASLFEKFYRLDEARNSNTGGAGLGLAIAKEIISLHGGVLTADSQNDTVVFTVTLPKTVKS